MALSEIKKYFDQGIREHLSEDYFMVGLIMGKGPCVAKILGYCKYTSNMYYVLSERIFGLGLVIPLFF